MLVGLLITLLAGPVGLEFFGKRGGLTVQIAFTATLIVSIWSLEDSRRLFITGVLLAVATLGATVIDLIQPSVAAEFVALASMLLFCTFSLIFAMRQVFTGDRINANRLVGAVCIYLLVGILLAVCNLLVDRLLPGSFKGVPSTLEENLGLDLIYYTFVTMTTLGYGDITPVRPIAKALAYLAAVAGQFYIAMLVGGLVAMYLTSRNKSV